MMAVITDEQLMLRVAAGNLDAFNKLVRRHQDTAWRIAHRFLGDSVKENLKALAIIFSVALNIVFIGSYVCHKFDLCPWGRQGGYNHSLVEMLNLSQEQSNRFEPICDQFHAFVSRQGESRPRGS